MEKNKDKIITSAKSWSGFPQKYPVLWNIILVVLAAFVLIWIMLSMLDLWTLHGDEDVVPSVRGMNYNQAENILGKAGMTAEITDSIFESTIAPGTVVDQNPKSNSKVKPGRTVYLTIVAFSPKLVTVPEFINASLRQGISIFEGLGLKKVDIVKVPSEYKDLVLGARYNGLPLQAGMKIPTTASVIIEVGAGTDEDNETERNSDDI
ncbi:MAG: PASTA domain-containing protein [Muribaculaceae bacterium]|nr:PASTA domain-containing protein [Muribaculaceae bacterium]MDE6610206.1 PASTA domain-containing protein [Muribaculaceae bacterium]